MKHRRFHFSTRGWFQLTMMPAIILVTVGLGWNVYQSLRHIILRSFEQKLGAVSTSVAAFIPPEDHAWLMEQPTLNGLAFGPDGLLFAFDSSRDVLMRIHPTNGVADEKVTPVPAGLRDLAFSRAENLLVALELPSGRLFTLDPETGKSNFLLSLGEKAQGLVRSPDGHVIAITDHLLRLDLKAATATPITDTPVPKILSAGYDSDHHVIRAISQSHRFIEIDPETAHVKVGVPLDEKAQLPGDLAYDEERHLMLGSNKSVLQVDWETGKVIPAHFLPAFGKELTPQYRAYSRPMLRLMNELDLTYLYTQIVVGSNKIIYGIDATQGENHSGLHSEDVIPEEEVAGVQELLRSGSLYHSPVTKWAQWGFLKGSSAPIFDDTGKVIAMAGADVEVSLIERRTRQAAIELLVVGAGSLLLASAVAIIVARRVRRPMQQIKSTALDVAAGHYSRRIHIDTPREAHDLANSFNQMAGSLEDNMNALHSSIHELLRNRNRYELARRLGQRHELAEVLGAIDGVTVAWRGVTRAVVCASGAVRHGDRVVVWLADSPADGLMAARARADLALRISARLQLNADDESSVPVPGQTVGPFGMRDSGPANVALPVGVRAVVLLSISGRTARVLGDQNCVDASAPECIRFTDADVTIEARGFTLVSEPA